MGAAPSSPSPTPSPSPSLSPAGPRIPNSSVSVSVNTNHNYEPSADSHNDELQKAMSMEPALSSSLSPSHTMSKNASDASHSKTEKKRRSNLLTLGKKKGSDVASEVKSGPIYKPGLESNTQLSITSLDQLFPTKSASLTALTRTLEQIDQKEEPVSSMTTLEVGKASFSGSASIPGVPESSVSVSYVFFTVVLPSEECWLRAEGILKRDKDGRVYLRFIRHKRVIIIGPGKLREGIEIVDVCVYDNRGTDLVKKSSMELVVTRVDDICLVEYGSCILPAAGTDPQIKIDGSLSWRIKAT
eukprot:TRINITY_DN2178_c0_g1_i2.p1 TRINITY_DN2178_c0_g1~~TRINITY_DN2178_c0_g1_i2.p1  ORF type:complete len:321 (+),score=30.59 TRINITY_DN2178_c0_g1_i2:66-965(+)